MQRGAPKARDARNVKSGRRGVRRDGRLDELVGSLDLPLPPEPRLILSTASMPETTRPQMVYWPSRPLAGANMMKNWLLPLFGFGRARHGAAAAHVRLRENSAGRFGSLRAAGAGAGRVAALGHEALDDAVEGRAIVEAVAHQVLDPLDMQRRQVGPQLDGTLPSLVSRISVFSSAGSAAAGMAWHLDRGLTGDFGGGAGFVAHGDLLWRFGGDEASADRSCPGSGTEPLPPLPRLILSTNSMPETTWPQIVYWPSRCGAGANMMKNWLLALFGSWCAPRPPCRAGSARLLVNSAGRLGSLLPPRAGAGRVAALGHEALDHAMERRAVVEFLAHQLLDPLDMLRRQLRQQLDHHPAVLEVHVQRVLGVELAGCAAGGLGS